MAAQMLSPARARLFHDWSATEPVGNASWGSIHREPSLAEVEWEYIQRILHDSDGNVTRAARRLGLHRRTLQRKLHKLPPLS